MTSITSTRGRRATLLRRLLPLARQALQAGSLWGPRVARPGLYAIVLVLDSIGV